MFVGFYLDGRWDKLVVGILDVLHVGGYIILYFGLKPVRCLMAINGYGYESFNLLVGGENPVGLGCAYRLSSTPWSRGLS